MLKVNNSIDTPPKGKRWVKFLNGQKWIVGENDCRGCFMAKNEKLMPKELEILYDTPTLTVRQDAEWPIPGFYIVAAKKHVESLADFKLNEAEEILRVVYWVRRGMREALGIKKVQIYHEEKLVRPHFHIWLLPLWPQILKKHRIAPKIYEGNIKTYIDLFDYEHTKVKIFKSNSKIKSYLSDRCKK